MCIRDSDTIDATPDFIACTRCGIEIIYNTIAKRVSRGNTDGRCRDCVATESGKGGSNLRGPEICNPWRGDFDLDTMQPLKDNGQPHMPGIRTCGNADCCNKAHVINFEALEAERNDLSYRTGTRLTYTGLMAALKKEAGQ
jgi:hypothetical protein